jgi:3-isopropylmalate/(R)-2-methylmalate dehydratase small subunit
VLNNPIYTGKILVAGKNFGSGSSREHAAWAIYDYGFRCVVSSFFADIFKNNSLNIGILPVKVSTEFLDKIFMAIEQNPKAELEVDLPAQKITIIGSDESESFDINGYKKHNMINGFDDIDFLQNIRTDIKTFAEQSLY